jgi:hypothetical protein
MEHPPRNADATSYPPLRRQAPTPLRSNPPRRHQVTHPVAQQPTPAPPSGASTDNTDSLQTPAFSTQPTEKVMVMPSSTRPMSVSAFSNTDTRHPYAPAAKPRALAHRPG